MPGSILPTRILIFFQPDSILRFFAVVFYLWFTLIAVYAIKNSKIDLAMFPSEAWKSLLFERET